MTLSKWEVVVWKARYLHARTSGLYYQRVDSKAQPKGKTVEILFASFAVVKALMGDLISLG